jgi:hypothetical protein
VAAVGGEMKREAKEYSAIEVTYKFSERDILEALCKVHDINLPASNRAAESYVCGTEMDGGYFVRIRTEKVAKLAPVIVPAEDVMCYPCFKGHHEDCTYGHCLCGCKKPSQRPKYP